MFNIRLRYAKAILCRIWLLFLLIGCQPVTNEGVGIELVTEMGATEQVGASLNAASLTPTRSISQTSASTPISIPSPTSSPTPQLSVTLLPIETVTPTPWPTLTSDEALYKVLSLLADNRNPDCFLPCWWGITPGQTHWQDLYPYLKSFALTIESFPEQSYFVAMFPVPENVNYRGKLNIGYRVDASETVTEVSIASVNIEGFDPLTMMTIYGVPDEVWLKTLDAPREGVLPFQLIIVYQQRSISLHYHVNATTDGQMVTACFEPGFVELESPDLFPAGPRIYLWEPGQYKTIDEIANIPREIYFPLAEKSDLTPQTLYEKFTSLDEEPCIDTPADLWQDY